MAEGHSRGGASQWVFNHLAPASAGAAPPVEGGELFLVFMSFCIARVFDCPFGARPDRLFG